MKYVLLIHLTVAVCLAVTAGAIAQELVAAPQTSAIVDVIEYPDSPGAVVVSTAEESVSSAADGGGLARTSSGGKYHRIIRPGQTVGPLSAGDKIKLSVLSRLTFVEIATTTYSAGISQLRDSKPHYGQDASAFGERFGAIALKHTSQAFFSYGLYAAAFHEDPRYYVLGRQHGVGNRIVYAATRLVVTKKDNGEATANWAKLAGLASSNALTNAYYPEVDRGGAEFAKSMGTSLYGTVINNEIHEFIGDFVRLVFHKRN